MNTSYDMTRALVDDRLATLRHTAEQNRLRRLARGIRRRHHHDDSTPTAA